MYEEHAPYLERILRTDDRKSVLMRKLAMKIKPKGKSENAHENSVLCHAISTKLKEYTYVQMAFITKQATFQETSLDLL